jgi:hypothetical protein
VYETSPILREIFFYHVFCHVLIWLCLLQERVGSLKGGVEFLQLCGFQRDEGEFLVLPRDKVDAMLLNTAGSELNSAINNPFFGVL